MTDFTRPEEFLKRVVYFNTILNETADLLSKPENLRDLQINEDVAVADIGEGAALPAVYLGIYLDWVSDELGTLAIELDQNLNPALRGDTDPNTGGRHKLE